MKRVALLMAALLAAALAAGPASAALRLLFSRTSAEPDATILLRTAGSPFRGSVERVRRRPPRVFMVDAAAAPEVRSARDRRLVPIGRLSVDRKGVGRLRFRVPNLRPGDYTTLAHCPTCGPRLVPTGPRRPFRVKPYLRDCESSVYGDLPADWESRSLRTGPLALYRFQDMRPGDFDPVGSVKLLLLLDNATTATLVVPAAERPYVSLTYGRVGLLEIARRVADGHVAVTFEACAPSSVPQTQFNGGFVVAGPRCARLEVHVAGSPEPLELRVPFGRPC